MSLFEDTNPRALKHPFAFKEAVAIVSSWLEQPCVTVLEPGERYWSVLGPLLPASQARGPLVSDAYLAALAIEHGAVLHTVDADFARFKGLKRVDPLEPAGAVDAPPARSPGKRRGT